MRPVRVVSGSLALLLAAVVAHADPADLDPTFGNGGKVTVPFSGGSSEANAVLVQPDGKIVAAGNTAADFALVRCNADGSLDTTFGTGGIVTTDFDGGVDVAHGVVRQADGNLVVAGSGSSPAALVLARYTNDGSLDATFGSGGRIVTAGLTANALVIQSDGKLVAGGPGSSGFMLARYLSDGTLDPTFGSGGIASTDFALANGLPPILFALALQTDGRLVAGGGAGKVITLARFESDGTLDATFGTGGQVTLDTTLWISFISNPSARAQSVAIEPGGGIAIAGSVPGYIAAPRSAPFPASVGVVGRLAADGTPDETYGFQGIVPLNSPLSSAVAANAVVLQPDGKAVAAGVDGVSTPQRLITRLTTTGAGDPSFGPTSSSPAGGSNALVEQSDRTLVAAGFGGTFSPRTFEIVRYKGGECGDGIVDAFEGCDDGNLTSGDGCDANCTPTGCGNGIVTAGEACEPQAPGDCCTAACQFEDAGAACLSDGDLCANHTCDGAGICQHVDAPSPSCAAAAPRGSTIKILHAFTARQKFGWSWKGPGVALDDLDDPTVTPYALCAYDHDPDPVTKLALPFPNPPFCLTCWRASPKGFDYKESSPAYAGVQRILLRTSTRGGTFKLKAKGASFPAIGALPMSVDPTVSVQLRNAQGGCWGADFSAPKANDPATFNAKSD